MVVFPSEAAVLQKLWVHFVFALNIGKNVFTNVEESFQKPLDDASSYKTTPRCLRKFYEYTLPHYLGIYSLGITMLMIIKRTESGYSVWESVSD